MSRPVSKSSSVPEHNSDLRGLMLQCLKPASGTPQSDVIADFHAALVNDGISPSRYVGKVKGVALRTLRELEERGAAKRQTIATTGSRLEDPLWGGAGFKPFGLDLAERRRAIDAKTRSRAWVRDAPQKFDPPDPAPAPKAAVKQKAAMPAPVPLPPPTLPDLRIVLREIEDIRARLGCVEGQVRAAILLEKANG